MPRGRKGLVASAAMARPEGPWSPRSPVFMGLAAVAMAVPLAVDARAAGPYDDPKAWALPVLVAVTAVLALAGRGDRGGRASAVVQDRPTRVLRWALLLSLAWLSITTAASIAPAQSAVGSFGRGMGLLTVSSGMALFFLVCSECRTREAVRALIDAALLGSAPVCLLALGQAAGWDPLPRAWDPAVATLRVRSTLGQHIFLGSYLAVLIPLAAARLDCAWRGWRASGTDGARLPLRALATGALWIAGVPVLVALAARWPDAWWGLVPWGVAGAVGWALACQPGARRVRGDLEVALLGSLLAVQVLVVVLSAARGPLLGMVFGLSVAGLIWLARRGARRALVASMAMLGILLVALVLLNVSRPSLGGLARVTALERLGQLADVRRGTPVWFRIEVWGGILSGWVRQMGGEDVLPGTRPLVRSAIGYGLESQLLILDQLALPRIGTFARGDGWRAQYTVDRAHNALLDQLLTGGLVGAGLWLVTVGALLTVGLERVRRAEPGDETSIRLGCLGAVLAHLAEGQVGIVTATPLALFSMVAGLLATPSRHGTAPSPAAAGKATRERRWLQGLSVGALALAGLFAAWAGTRWLMASTAYADGVRHSIAGQPVEALASFRRSRDLMPWLAGPAEAFARTALALATPESDPGRRLQKLREAEAALAAVHDHALPGATFWGLIAQIALAEARAGERHKLPVSVDAFGRALMLRPQDASLMAQSGLAWLESGNPVRAREAAQRALSLPGGRDQWLVWAVLSRAARELGDEAQSGQAAERARSLAPPGARPVMEGLLSGARGP